MVSRKGLYRGMKSVQVIPRTLETFISDLIIILKNIYLTAPGLSCSMWDLTSSLQDAGL